MKLIGITGGIGSGKSVVSRILSVMGYPVYDSDSRAKGLMNQSPEIRAQLIPRFGSAVYGASGLDRSYLAARIFSDRDNLLFVNSVVHPVVCSDFVEWAHSQASDMVFVESAILFSSGLHRLVSSSVFVDAPSEVRLNRAVMRDASSRDAVAARMRNQRSDDEYARSRCEYCLLNDNSALLIPQVLDMVNKFAR